MPDNDTNRGEIAVQQPFKWEQVPALADRLGVKQLGEDEQAEVVLHTPDGIKYDICALINAVLDRLEESTR